MLYNKLQNRTQELRITKAAAVGNVRVIDFAMIPEKRIKPRTKNILIFSFGYWSDFGCVLCLYDAYV